MSYRSDSLQLGHELVCEELGVVEALRDAFDASKLVSQVRENIVVNHHIHAALENPNDLSSSSVAGVETCWL